MEIKTYRSIDMAATGRNIARLRESHGFSVADFQRFFGFSAPQAIYKWQKGLTLPSTDNLYALSDLLGVPMEDILVPQSDDATPPDESHRTPCDSVFFPESHARPPTAA